MSQLSLSQATFIKRVVPHVSGATVDSFNSAVSSMLSWQADMRKSFRPRFNPDTDEKTRAANPRFKSAYDEYDRRVQHLEKKTQGLHVELERAAGRAHLKTDQLGERVGGTDGPLLRDYILQALEAKAYNPTYDVKKVRNELKRWHFDTRANVVRQSAGLTPLH